MSKKITNAVIEYDGGNHVTVYSDVLTKDDLLSIAGVSEVYYMGRNFASFMISPLYDKQSACDDIIALADKLAKEREEGCIDEELPTKPAPTTPGSRQKQREFESLVIEKYLHFRRNNVIDICVYQQRPYTHSIVTYLPTLETGHGFTKCKWPDPWDEEFGKELAVKKAARNLARILYP